MELEGRTIGLTYRELINNKNAASFILKKKVFRNENSSNIKWKKKKKKVNYSNE